MVQNYFCGFCLSYEHWAAYRLVYVFLYLVWMCEDVVIGLLIIGRTSYTRKDIEV